MADRKTEHAPSLVVLGLRVQLDSRGFTAVPDEGKVAKWCGRLEAALAGGTLEAGAASKLAGALSWATSHMFQRVGRAMLRALFAHSKKGSPALGKELRRGLEWWLATLRRGVAERRVPTRPTADPPVLMWTDARAVPPRLAAVVLMRGRWTYTDAAPPAELMGCARPARA